MPIACDVLGTMLSALQRLIISLNPHDNAWGRHYYYPNFAGDKLRHKSSSELCPGHVVGS